MQRTRNIPIQAFEDLFKTWNRHTKQSKAILYIYQLHTLCLNVNDVARLEIIKMVGTWNKQEKKKKKTI